jgi:methionyl aminopeptidase
VCSDDASSSSRALLRPGIVTPGGAVPSHIPRPPYADTGALPEWDSNLQIHKTPEELSKMRAACKLAAQVLDYAGTLVKPGVTTDAIDQAVHKMIIDAGAYPSPLNYGKFPKSVCTSVNECICHGIPDDRQLVEGDIINIDVTVFLNGYHGDTSRMFHVGQVSPEAARLCKATTEALMAGINACGPGAPLKGIGHAIHNVADSYKLNLSKSFIGHGVGTVFHCSPHVVHTRNNEPGVMVPGQTFTIEPMLCIGSAREKFWKDGWTAVTTDGSLSAQQEHTLLITENGVEILTVA